MTTVSLNTRKWSNDSGDLLPGRELPKWNANVMSLNFFLFVSCHSCVSWFPLLVTRSGVSVVDLAEEPRNTQNTRKSSNDSGDLLPGRELPKWNANVMSFNFFLFVSCHSCVSWFPLLVTRSGVSVVDLAEEPRNTQNTRKSSNDRGDLLPGRELPKWNANVMSFNFFLFVSCHSCVSWFPLLVTRSGMSVVDLADEPRNTQNTRKSSNDRGDLLPGRELPKWNANVMSFNFFLFVSCHSCVSWFPLLVTRSGMSVVDLADEPRNTQNIRKSSNDRGDLLPGRELPKWNANVMSFNFFLFVSCHSCVSWFPLLVTRSGMSVVDLADEPRNTQNIRKSSNDRGDLLPGRELPKWNANVMSFNFFLFVSCHSCVSWFPLLVTRSGMSVVDLADEPRNTRRG